MDRKKMGWKQAGWIGVSIVLAFSLAGCGKQESGSGDIVDPGKLDASASPAATAAASSEAQSKKTVYPLKIKDATGTEITFEKAPERIVSVSPAETEALFAIGLDNQIVGVSDYDDYPEAAKSKPKMGGVVKPNQEAMIAANADVVFTGISMKNDTVGKLREMNLKVFKVEPKTLDGAIEDIITFGIITDHQAEAEQVAAQMKADRQKVVDAVKDLKPEEKKKVYIEFSAGWTVGSGEFMDEIIQLAGGVNIAGDTQGWHQISEEKVIQQNPAVIFYSKGVVDDKSQMTLDQIIRGRSGWGKIDAVANNRVIGIEQNLLSRPGPRLTSGLLEMAKGIYPDRVK